ncbi:MAG: hypothetical protein ACRCYQ_04805 [Nocardioides sp.]
MLTNGPALLISAAVTTNPAGRVTVEAMLWPNPDSLDLDEVGDVVRLRPVPVAISGTTYEVHVDPAAVPAEYRADGKVDIEVSVSSGDISDPYAETAKNVGGPGRRPRALPGTRARESAFRRACVTSRLRADPRRRQRVRRMPTPR